MPIESGFLNVCVKENSELCTGCHLPRINDLEAIDPRLFLVSCVSSTCRGILPCWVPSWSFPIGLGWLWIVPTQVKTKSLCLLLTSLLWPGYVNLFWHLKMILNEFIDISYLKRGIICTFVWKLFTNFGKQPNWFLSIKWKDAEHETLLFKARLTRQLLSLPLLASAPLKLCGPGMCLFTEQGTLA